MEFRWIALLALWTLISGPILGVSSNPGSKPKVIPTSALKAVLPPR